MTEKLVLLDATRGGVAVVTLNRPHLHNAFNADVVEQLTDIFEELRGADGVRCVLIEGAGESFSAGMDIEWMRFAADYTFDDNLADAKAIGHMLQRFHELPQPTIALVHGAAIGAGAGLTAAADIALADKSAFFAFAEVKLGITPSVIAPYAVEAIGMRAARRYFLTGERFTADEALRLGLVHAVVETRQALADLSEKIVSEVFGAAPGAVAGAKTLLATLAGKPHDAHLMAELARHAAESRATAEAKEGLSAYLEKRKPGWFAS
jgi:methylglutaconyl-CoA hydratase